MISLGALTDCRADTPSSGDFIARTGPGSRVSLESLFAKQVYSVSVISSEYVRLDRDGHTVFASDRDKVIFTKSGV